ncbi:MAG: ribonuclease III [Thermonemataceae bacterium]|nr:ribonuclease III [Thermonemataceae bacterium]
MQLIQAFWRVFRKKTEQDKRLIAFVKQRTGAEPFNLELYRLALRHSSMALQTHKENFKLSNERLEYLGDAVLGAIVAEYLYKKYPFKDEGFLTEIRSRIVNRESLNSLSKKIGLADLVEFEGSKFIRSHQSMAGDAMEAFIGAVFLDKGFIFCKKFVIKRILQAHLDIEKIISNNLNFKSLLIEYAQKEGKDIEFSLLDEKSQKGSTIFTVELLLDGVSIGVGMGQNKKKAEQAAAEKAYQYIQNQKES